jgi:cysteinyl-tRNA synthetase
VRIRPPGTFRAVNPIRIILFGSFAKGNATSLSDADFLVIEDTTFGEQKSRRKEAAKILRALLHFDAFFNERWLSATDVSALKNQPGRMRLVLAYMSIGEAEDYRYYWDSTWTQNPPLWLAGENPDWEGNFKVRYWEKGWQDIIFGGDSTYLGKIIAAGFGGVYLDIIDAFEYFE